MFVERVMQVAVVEPNDLVSEALCGYIPTVVQGVEVGRWTAPPLTLPEVDVTVLGPSCPVPVCLEWHRNCRSGDPRSGVLALRASHRPLASAYLLNLGLEAVLDEKATSAELAFALSEVANGRTFVNHHLRMQLATADGHLTGRETEILGLLMEGLSNKLIARKVGTSVKTVDSQMSRLYRKLHVESRTQALLATVGALSA